MNRYAIALAAALCTGTSLYFLNGDAPQDLELVSELMTQVLSDNAEGIPVEQPVVKSEQQADTLENAENSVAETLEEETAAAGPFQPPSPERVRLFQAPKRQGRGRTTVKGQSRSSVELLGFVDVDGPKVALLIDGTVATVGEGEKQYGIEVISIQPPAVVLRRGGQRWQASFEN